VPFIEEGTHDNVTDPTTREFYRLAITALVDYDALEPDRVCAAGATVRIAQYRVVVTDVAFDSAVSRTPRLQRLMKELTSIADDASGVPDVLASVHRIQSLINEVGDCIGE
jgi:hypothetical protein